MTKKQYEMNNLLHNTEVALMNGNLSEAEEKRLRQRQRDLRNNLRRAAEKPSLLSVKHDWTGKKNVIKISFSDGDKVTVTTTSDWVGACLTKKNLEDIWTDWTATKNDLRRALERL